jgi:hypothetical protein
MSSSTISRADESARLKDLDETFEERYAKVSTSYTYEQYFDILFSFLETHIWTYTKT